MNKGDLVGNSNVTQWEGLYNDSWKGLIVDEAFAHP
jgi:hypothetical protein